MTLEARQQAINLKALWGSSCWSAVGGMDVCEGAAGGMDESCCLEAAGSWCVSRDLHLGLFHGCSSSSRGCEQLMPCRNSGVQETPIFMTHFVRLERGTGRKGWLLGLMSTHRKSKSHRIEWKEETLLQSVETHSAEAGPAKHRHCVPPLKTKRQRLLWKKSSSWVYTDAAFIPSSEKSGRSFPADRWMLIDLPSVDEESLRIR